MTEIHKWFNENYNHLRNEFKTKIANGQMSQYADDLLQFIIESFLQKPIEQQEQMLRDGKIKNFLVKAAALQIKSGSSPFFRRYREYYSRNGYLNVGMHEDWTGSKTDEFDMIGCIEDEMKNLNWYENQLIQMRFFQGMSMRQIIKKYNLPKNTMSGEYEKIFDKIRCECLTKLKRELEENVD